MLTEARGVPPPLVWYDIAVLARYVGALDWTVLTGPHDPSPIVCLWQFWRAVWVHGERHVRGDPRGAVGEAAAGPPHQNTDRCAEHAQGGQEQAGDVMPGMIPP
jgi:hypothetical protein